MQQSRHASAVADMAARNEQRRISHLPVAVALRDPQRAPSVIDAARHYVIMWREKQLCSIDYIEEWEALLADPEAAAAVLESKASRAQQLRQNSPFVSSIRALSMPRAA